MGMARPRLDDLLVELTGDAQTFFVGLFIAGGVGSGGVILLGTVGSTHQMEHGIVTLQQFVGVGACHRRNLLPLLGLDIGRDIHRAAVANDEHGLGAYLGQMTELILKGQLGLQDGALALIVQVSVGCKIVPACGAVDCGHLGHVKHLVTESGEIFRDFHQSSGFTGTRATGEDDFLNVRHIINRFRARG